MIEVWQEENLRAEVMVSPDGTISFPLVSVIPAAGKTTGELKDLLRKKLEEYIPEPEVNVSLITVEGNLIYVIGEVTRPGPLIMLDYVMSATLPGPNANVAETIFTLCDVTPMVVPVRFPLVTATWKMATTCTRISCCKAATP